LEKSNLTSSVLFTCGLLPALCRCKYSNNQLDQAAGIAFEALRLTMVDRLLNSVSPDSKMDGLVSLYYFAPACAVINLIFTYFVEFSRIAWLDITRVGIVTLTANAFVAFLLNVAIVLLASRPPSSLP